MKRTRTAVRILLCLSLAANAKAAELPLEAIVEAKADEVVARHMAEKRIPGMSVAVVVAGELVLAKGYGLVSVEHNLPARADTVYPISSVSRLAAGTLALRLADAGRLDLDASIATYLDDVPADKRAITVRNLLQHTHGLTDFYRSDAFASAYPGGEAGAADMIDWSLEQPLVFEPGSRWAYGVIGYVVLGAVFERVGGAPYPRLVDDHVFAPLGMTASFGGTETLVVGRNPILYELVEGEIHGHIVEFPPPVWAAGGMNASVTELAKLFVALSGEALLDDAAKQEMWQSVTLGGGADAHYGLGWMSFTTSAGHRVVGHEGGGASWVEYYPDQDVAVIALSNMSGARADSLPYDIALGIFAAIDGGAK